MYLAGIIPGPKQPSLENLNHYIRPLIQQLAESWERGVWYSRTANSPQGRLTRSAIALAVCDLPAARHLSALASVGSHFICSVCNCYHKTSYGRVDYEKWVLRDKDKLRRCAELWRDAATVGERDRLFKEHGVRWSELWWLPYWDPARQLVIDSMHCILEGLVQHHSRNLLRLTTEKTSPSPSPSTTSTPAFTSPFPPIVRELSKPSWFGPVPAHFGDASAGSIKADEWRSLITVYIPLAVINVWGTGTDPDAIKALQSTMDLVSAVYLACARTMSVQRAKAYQSYIAAYVGKLKESFPMSNLRPNHHASFHIYDYLILFGPVHSWWTYPFERLIGFLQRLPTNHKTG
ncbi:hypothetical protein EV363DRAFT_1179737, partial [Boletus edulis]